jgi:Holliday junction resolvase-like predicted endonuclease
MGYRIITREQAPEWIKAVGGPDIIAVEDDEYVLVEVKPSDQLKRYSKAKARLILVTDIDEGKVVEVWGMKELLSIS